MEWAARAIGLFYVLGGLLVIRRARANWMLDDAIARITMRRTPLVERTAGLAMFVIAALTLVSGCLLVVWSPWTWIAFIACWATQAAYLLWAQRWYAPEDETDRLGRRRSINALAVFSIATAVVLWLTLEGGLG